MYNQSQFGVICGHPEGGPTAYSKNFKIPFLRDNEKSFQEVTPMGPETHLFFLIEISQQIWLQEAFKALAKCAMAGMSIEQVSKFLHQIITKLCLLSGENFRKIAQTIF